jgi:hypothetical protein
MANDLGCTLRYVKNFNPEMSLAGHVVALVHRYQVVTR